MTSLIEFRWWRPKNGYRWMAGVHERPLPRIGRGGIVHVYDGSSIIEERRLFDDQLAPFLSPVLRDPSWQPPYGLDQEIAELDLAALFAGEDPIEYDLNSEAPALFREFAELPPTLKFIKEFADRWGLLGSEGTMKFQPVYPDKPRPSRFPAYWGEALDMWIVEMKNMASSVELWDLLRRKEFDKLTEEFVEHDGYIIWSPSLEWEFSEEYILLEDLGDKLIDFLYEDHSQTDCYRLTSIDAPTVIAGPDHHPERREVIDREGIGVVAEFCLHDAISYSLARRASVVLKGGFGSSAGGVRLSPINLIGALWLQFALAVDGNVGYAHCQSCGSWFPIASGAGRTDKRYCSDACRMRAYRQRKRQSTAKGPTRSGGRARARISKKRQ